MACACCLASLSLSIPFSSLPPRRGFERWILHKDPVPCSVQACPIHRHPCPNLIESLEWTPKGNTLPAAAIDRVSSNDTSPMTLCRKTRLVSYFLPQSINHARLRKNSPPPSTPFPFSARNFEPWQ
ncbi:hypothetical protein LB506_001183 [Fusarium annulatum]|nr:hypothetical protein LB506_001183 [Fusarium annulatum]